jgi:hypothetical protein
MHSLLEGTLEGFKRFFREQQELAGEATFTLIQFDDQIEFVCEALAINYVLPLSLETFVPRGLTALFDAIERAIQSAKREEFPQTPGVHRQVIVVILTASLEN